MAGSFNKMTVIGNLGADPEMRYTPSGAQVTTFNVAVNDRRRTPDGQTVDSTMWFRISCWNRLAEVASQYLHKGSSVYVEGPLTAREWTGSDGQKRTSLEVTAREMKMLDARGAMEAGDIEMGSAPASPSAPNGGSSRTTHQPAALNDDIDGIPF